LVPAPSDVPKAYVGEHIRDELLRDPDIGELDIHVAIEGNLVVVTGHVSTDDRRRAISAALNRLMPDHEIRNETTVAVYPEAPTPSQP
jgi:hypothetical protein